MDGHIGFLRFFDCIIFRGRDLRALYTNAGVCVYVCCVACVCMCVASREVTYDVAAISKGVGEEVDDVVSGRKGFPQDEVGTEIEMMGCDVGISRSGGDEARTIRVDEG